MTSNSLSMAAIEQTAVVEKDEPSWHWLYKMGGAAAMVSVLVIPITILVFIIWPPPDSVIGYFEQFQNSWLLGLLGMDLLYLLANILLIPTWLALYVAPRPTNESLMAVALILGLLAAVIDAPGAAYSAALVDNRVDTTGHAH